MRRRYRLRLRLPHPHRVLCSVCVVCSVVHAFWIHPALPNPLFTLPLLQISETMK